ncbi:K+-dependent Na+/Ca+ exchanger related-protein [Oceanicola granulosus HTCC2516]|uniref:K+-dependent Na+/Ca+ exchanger related-protein n=1 Tax=Oceanicola granulosus (strain ATCC BAA-861 / DSM 15982 / KCTC 12143 / HTCC2516) TaxID=314256 RepID=Q2CCH8_OCEGH|nr:calcium/sodium antiporter [Oceanicola granulosus]EAR50340.1 K+-dependent Na+/Ca+ exchanger related-protein [Oceanicola granulosus HTCC2516]
MIWDWLYVAVGLVILLLAGDALVKGAVNLALRIGIPALIVSLTIVAFGTSAPELLIAIGAILDGYPGLALGNVVGSNTANILLVVGVPAIIATMHTSQCDSRHSFIQMICATALFIVLCFFQPITWIHGLILLAALAAMLTHAGVTAKRHRDAQDDEIEGVEPGIGWPKILFYLALGLIGLPLGADLLVEGSVNIARTFGVSETVIGLTLVAIGTSLPELATTVMAAIRRQADVALGNVIGSNMFNLLGITGIAALVGPIPVEPRFLQVDLWIMLAASLLLIPFVFLRADVTRLWGIGLTGLYAAYLVVILA